MILRKDQLEASLHEEKKLIESGVLKEDSPLDLSEEFRALCEACRRGDLKTCQEAITNGANINARDQFDYTPLILASLCGHYDVVSLLLESGALCERDTFQGERCLYNALNDRIRNLLLKYDYSKSTNPLQPLAQHVYSFLTRYHPRTSDIAVTSAGKSFQLHKFVLAARSPYFRRKLAQTPEATSWKLPSSIPPQAFDLAIRYIYFGETPSDIGGGPGTGFTDEEVLAGVDKLGKQLEIGVGSLWDLLLAGGDNKRIARQKRVDEVENGRNQLEAWFLDNIVKHKIEIETSKANSVKWDRENGIFADVLLRADEVSDTELDTAIASSGTATPNNVSIPIGPSSSSLADDAFSTASAKPPSKSTLFPAHRAMLLRSDYFLTMFSSSFLEAQDSPHLRIVPVSCTPAVLSLILSYLYTEKSDIPLELAVDVLFAADELFIEKLKTKAAVVIATLGNGTMEDRNNLSTNVTEVAVAPDSSSSTPSSDPSDPIDPYLVLRAAWLTRVPRLEQFAARYFAYRLERYLDDEDFAAAIRESAARIEQRQDTDSIELVDDIRYYLSERFRLRFEDVGWEEMEEGQEEEGKKEGESKVGAGAGVGNGPLITGQAKEEKGISPSSTCSSNIVQRPRQGLVLEQGDSAVPVPAPTKALNEAAEEQDPDHAIFTATDTGSAGGAGGTGVAGGGEIRTLDGDLAGDEFAADAQNYQILLARIDALLERLRLDA